tara:strand:+ start:402 stop:617 length:216 start_codon:yes stop_codon:yes gene_type:complete
MGGLGAVSREGFDGFVFGQAEVVESVGESPGGVFGFSPSFLSGGCAFCWGVALLGAVLVYGFGFVRQFVRT